MIFGHVGRSTGEGAEDLGQGVVFAFVAFGPEMTFERLPHDLRLGPTARPRRALEASIEIGGQVELFPDGDHVLYIHHLVPDHEARTRCT